MLVTITSKRQVTFPAHVLASLGAQPGDRLELFPSPQGLLIRARRVDTSLLAPLRDAILAKSAKSAEPMQKFDMHSFLEQPYAPALRD